MVSQDANAFSNWVLPLVAVLRNMIAKKGGIRYFDNLLNFSSLASNVSKHL